MGRNLGKPAIFEPQRMALSEFRNGAAVLTLRAEPDGHNRAILALDYAFRLEVKRLPRDAHGLPESA